MDVHVQQHALAAFDGAPPVLLGCCILGMMVVTHFDLQDGEARIRRMDDGLGP